MASTIDSIICLSSQKWDKDLWTNKQHIMDRLQNNYPVMHIDYGFEHFPAWFLENFKKRNLSSYFKLGIHQRKKNLYIGKTLSLPIISYLPINYSLREGWDFYFKVRQAKWFLTKHGVENSIIWVYHPGFAPYLKEFTRSLIVYDCVDDYATFPEYTKNKKLKKWITDQEKQLCQYSDIIFTTSSYLFDIKHSQYPEKSYYVHNVGDYDHFSLVQSDKCTSVKKVSNIKGKKICFVGAISDYKVRIDWIYDSAKINPEFNYILIGPIGLSDKNTDVSILKSLPNVYFFGKIDYSLLPSFLKSIDVCIIPYKVDGHTKGVFPIKFFEFLATGKPVVISNLPSLKEYYKFVFVAKNKNEFSECINKAIVEGSHMREKRIQLAKKNKWNHRIEHQLKIINDKLNNNSIL